jgi:hypothetical protein
MLGKFLRLFRTRRGAPCRASATHKPAAPRRARPSLEGLESRLVLSGTSFVDVYCDSAPGRPNHYEIAMYGTGNSVLIDHDPAGYIHVTALNGTTLTSTANRRETSYYPSLQSTPLGPTAVFSDQYYDDIWVEGNAGGDNVDVNRIAKPLVFQPTGGVAVGAKFAPDAHTPTDHLHLGYGALQGLQAPILVLEPNGGTVAVDVNDQSDPAAHTAVLGASGPYGAITGLSPSPIYYQTDHLTALNLHLGPGTRAVEALSTFVTTNVASSAPTDVLVGNGNTGGIRGTLNLSEDSPSGAGPYRLVLDDHADATPHAVALDTGVGDGTLATVTGLSPAPVEFNTALVTSLDLRLGTSAGNTLLLYGANDPTYRTATLDAAVPFAPGSPFYGVYGTVTGLMHATIRYTGGLGSVAVHTGPGGAMVNVLDTGLANFSLPRVGPGGTAGHITIAMPPTTLVGHGALDVNVGNHGSLRGILGPLTVTSTAFGGTTLNVDDSADPANHVVTLDTASPPSALWLYGTVTGLSPGAISYRTSVVHGVTVQTGTGAETVNVLSAFAPLSVVGHSGNTAVNVGRHGSIAGITADLAVGGTVAGGTRLKVDDSADPVSHTVSVAQQDWCFFDSDLVRHCYLTDVVTGLTRGNISYSAPALAGLELDTGTGAQTVNVLMTDVPTTLAGHSFVFDVNVGTGWVDSIAAPLTVTNTYSRRTVLDVNDSEDTYRSLIALGTGGASLHTGPTDSFHPLGLYSADLRWASDLLLGLTVHTGLGGTVVWASDPFTPTSLVGRASAADVLFEQDWYGRWHQAGTGLVSLYSDLSYSGF